MCLFYDLCGQWGFFCCFRSEYRFTVDFFIQPKIYKLKIRKEKQKAITF